MDEKQGETSSDSDIADSWTIVDKNSFCNRVLDAIGALQPEEFSDISDFRDCALNFQDDSTNDADADSDGISVISESDEHPMANPASTYAASYSTPHTPTSSPEPNHCCLEAQHEYSRTIQPETRTPKKKKSKFNKPLTPPNTPVDYETPIFQDKSEKKHKKRSYVHNRNDKVSNILNILVAGTIATAAGLAFGHLMGSKSDCAKLAAGMKSELTFKQLQYENYKLRHELQDLKRESFHSTNRFNKHAAKGRRNVTDSIPVNISLNSSKYKDYNKVDFTDKNNFSVSETCNNPVFFGPKTYADTINSNFQKFDSSKVQDKLNTANIDMSSEKKKGSSLSSTVVHKLEPTGFPEEPFADQNKQARNHSYPSIHESDVKADTKEIKNTPQTDEQQSISLDSENCKASRQKNSKIKPNASVKDSKRATVDESEANAKKSNLQKSNDNSSKSKRKAIQKDRSASKKARSISSGKESGDFGNSAISLEDKLGEKKSIQETEQAQIAKPKVECKNSQKNSKLNRKYKVKTEEEIEMQNSSENNSKANRKRKLNRANQYSEEDLPENPRKEVKRNNKKERKLSKIGIPKSESLNQEVTLDKDKRNSDKFFKTKQKNDRRKSDFRQEKRDKYDEWEMNNGYEYYLSNIDGLPEDFSDDESTNKIDHHSREKTAYSTDDPLNSKFKSKKGYDKKANSNNILNDMHSQSEHVVSEAKTSDTDMNNIDGFWLDDIAKSREEKRNKQKESDWLFERARDRDLKRDKAAWYFKRMNDREQCRVQEKSKRNNTKRSSKRSPNYRSKL